MARIPGQEMKTTLTSFSEKLRMYGVLGATRKAYAKLARTMFPILDPHSYLTDVTGVIHVGANLGQERDLYAKHGLSVLWIEPLPDVFAQLCKNIKYFPNQIAVNYLITDRDNEEYLFYVANNEGQSSSIFELARHREIWPDVHYTSSITLTSITLDSLIKNIGVNINSYQALVMDTQGSELLVLKGAMKSIDYLKFIKTEAADFESYVHCARVEELTSYLGQFRFRLIRSDKFAETPAGGQYFDLLYKKF
jgi:FkbM family methyltransferase